MDDRDENVFSFFGFGFGFGLFRQFLAAQAPTTSVDALLVRQLADFVLLQQHHRELRVTAERLGRVLSAVLENDVSSARMLRENREVLVSTASFRWQRRTYFVEEFGYIVYAIVEHNPTVGQRVVVRYLSQRKFPPFVYLIE